MARRNVSKAVLNEALELISTGHADKAVAVCLNAIEENPKDVNLLGMLGAIYTKMGRYRDASVALKATIEMAPSFAKPHEDLGYVLIELRQPTEALDVLENATRLDPSLERAHFLKGQALGMLGKGKESDEAYEKSFDLNPERKKLALAAEHHKEGRHEQAEKLYKEILQKNPKNVDALRLLGVVAFRASRMDDAERLIKKSIDLAPDYAGAIIDLGRVYKEQNRYEEAIECFRKAQALEPENEQIPFLLGSTLARAALTYDAVKAYERAIELQPRHPGAMLGLGHVLKTVGRQDEAIAAYRKCTELKPDNGECYWSLANLKTYRFSDDEIKGMQDRLAKGELESQSEVNFLFALAKSFDDCGDYKSAWEYYDQGNKQQRMLESYDPVENEIIADTMIDIFAEEFLQANKGLGCPDNSPIFVVGLPRSGSTLIEQIISSHSTAEGTAELPCVGRVSVSLNLNRADGINYPLACKELKAENFRSLGEDYLEMAELHRTEGSAHFIDKMPNNFPHIGFMHLILPNAKIIDARRNPMDTCVGGYRQLFARGQPFTYDLTDIGEYWMQYERLMDHWHSVIPGKVLTVQYEDVVTDFDNQVRRILEFCELPFEESCLRFHETERPIRTASSEQVRQPVYQSSVNHWLKYDAHLGELKEVLEPVVERYRQYDEINR